MRDIHAENYVFSLVMLIIAFLVIYPIGMMIAGTFFVEGGDLTLKYWQEVWTKPILFEAIKNTLVATSSATAIAVVLGVVLSFIVSRTDTPMRRHFELISILPFITPPIIAGFAWTFLAEKKTGLLNILLDYLGLPFRFNVMSLIGVIFVTTLYVIPLVFLIINSVMRTLNPELEEAATVAGAGMVKTFFRITLPILAPGITSAALLAFMYSNIVFGIHATLGMPVNIWFLTTIIYQSLSVVPIEWNQAAIVAFILMLFGAAATYLQIRFLGRRGYTTLTGKGFRPKIISLGRWRWATWGGCVLYVFMVAILPYLILFLRSIKPYTFQPGLTVAGLLTGWEFDKYLIIFSGEVGVIRSAILNSFFLALGAATAIITLTSISAYILSKTKVWGRQALNFLCMIPLALPGIVLGVAILWGYTREFLMLYGTIWVLLVAYVTKDLPLGLRSIHASFLQVHPELEESARVCGSSWFKQFIKITLPLVKPGFVIGFVLVFASIMREIGASILLYSYGNEIVAYILFNLWENGEFQTLSSFILVTTALTMTAVWIMLKASGMKFIDLTRSEVRQT